MNIPIFIPSKGRAGKSKTIEILSKNKIDFTVCVEPQELEIYKKNYPSIKFLHIHKNDQGIAYVRNWILSHCVEAKKEWYWMLDDDITGFFQTISGKNNQVEPAVALQSAFKLFKDVSHILPVVIGGLEYQQYAWSAKKPYVINSYTEVAVCINTKNVVGNYDAGVAGKEDRDFVIQHLTKGKYSVRVQYWSFSCPKNGSNAGGLSESFYAAGKEAAASKALAAKWSRWVTFQIKSDGRPDAKINWRAFTPRLSK